jgi:hypothetical protein
MIRIDPEIKFFAEQVASANNRSFSNLVEFLLSKEIADMRKSGYNFTKYNEASTEFVGKGKDETLTEKFEEFTGNKV